jgi:hypothetical protein
MCVQLSLVAWNRSTPKSDCRFKIQSDIKKRGCDTITFFVQFIVGINFSFQSYGKIVGLSIEQELTLHSVAQH